MVKSWKLLFTQHAQKDAKKISAAKLKGKVIKLLDILKEDPFKIPPSYEKLIGDLSGLYSRRINLQHRLVYQGYLFDNKTLKRLWYPIIIKKHLIKNYLLLNYFLKMKFLKLTKMESLNLERGFLIHLHLNLSLETQGVYLSPDLKTFGL